MKYSGTLNNKYYQQHWSHEPSKIPTGAAGNTPIALNIMLSEHSSIADAVTFG